MEFVGRKLKALNDFLNGGRLSIDFLAYSFLKIERVKLNNNVKRGL